MNDGIRPSCGGTIIVANKKTKKKLRPLNGILAKAKPANEQKNRTKNVIAAEINNELKMEPKKFVLSNTFIAFSTKVDPGIIAGGIRFTSEFVLDPITNIQ